VLWPVQPVVDLVPSRAAGHSDIRLATNGQLSAGRGDWDSLAAVLRHEAEALRRRPRFPAGGTARRRSRGTGGICDSALRSSLPSAIARRSHSSGRSPVLSCKLANPRGSLPIPAPLAQARADELQRHLARFTGHEQVRVRPYGKHLLIQMHRGDDVVDTVARLTELDAIATLFRSHTGRWEPLPITGDLKQAADSVATLLAPFLSAE
jgi:hypothetical protein